MIGSGVWLSLTWPDSENLSERQNDPLWLVINIILREVCGEKKAACEALRVILLGCMAAINEWWAWVLGNTIRPDHEYLNYITTPYHEFQHFLLLAMSTHAASYTRQTFLTLIPIKKKGKTPRASSKTHCIILHACPSIFLHLSRAGRSSARHDLSMLLYHYATCQGAHSTLQLVPLC
jgi:hypothetical protein